MTDTPDIAKRRRAVTDSIEQKGRQLRELHNRVDANALPSQEDYDAAKAAAAIDQPTEREAA